MLKDLDSYYRENKISAVNFACGKRADCSAGCAEADFVTAREAFVGREYERGVLPRLLFISLDPADDWPGREPEKRTLQALRDYEVIPCDPGKKNAHWYVTHEFAQSILAPFALEVTGQGVAVGDVCQFFAHTNSAKCKNAAEGTNQGRPQFFANCREFLPGEVEVLKPAIIVTQGDWAREAMHDAFPVLARQQMPGEPTYAYEVVRLLEHTAIKFHMPHPRAAGPFSAAKRVAFPWYVECAQCFVRGTLG